MKQFWEDIKKQLALLTLTMLLGFVLGKIYTWDTLITDCKVLGTFRIANTAFYCKPMAPMEAPK